MEELRGNLFRGKTSQRTVATRIFRKRNIGAPPHPFQKALTQKSNSALYTTPLLHKSNKKG